MIDPICGMNVELGQRFDVVWTAREPGRWLLHCHIPHHMLNDNVEEKGGGGLTMIINVTFSQYSLTEGIL